MYYEQLVMRRIELADLIGRTRELRDLQQASDLQKLSSGKPLTSYIAQAELCKSRLNSVSYLLTGQFNM